MPNLANGLEPKSFRESAILLLIICFTRAMLKSMD